MVKIRHERPADTDARERLLDLAYGAERFAKPSARLREDRAPAPGLSFVAMDGGEVVGTLRLWPVTAGAARPALLLGPLAVHPDRRGRGIGSALVRRALRDAQRRDHRTVLLVGDSAYYARFGFSAEKTGWLRLPGLHEQHRLLGLELTAGALDGARGFIRVPKRPLPALAPLLGVGRSGIAAPRLA